MDNANELVTKKYLTESFKDFGETLMKIFVTKGELNDRMDKLEDRILKNNEKLLKSNDRIVKMLIEAEAERAATTHRMDRIESDFGPRITALEEAHKEC